MVHADDIDDQPGPAYRPSIVKDHRTDAVTRATRDVLGDPGFAALGIGRIAENLADLVDRRVAVRPRFEPDALGPVACQPLKARPGQIGDAVDWMQCDPGIFEHGRARQVQGQWPGTFAGPHDRLGQHLLLSLAQ